MNRYMEDSALEEIREYVLNNGLPKLIESNMAITADQIGWAVTEDINSKGAVTLLRTEAYDFLSKHPLATSQTIKYMIDSLGEDYEDIYYPDDAEDDEIDGTYEFYIKWHSDKVMATMFVAVAREMIELCPYVQEHWGDPVDMSEAGDILIEQLKSFNLDDIEMMS